MRSTAAKFITVVSGLPRSGTSMMMRMLDAGGIPAMTDNLRQADADNPGGYYEFEPVKQLHKDASWLADAYDKAVKVIYRLLYQLPQDHRYKVIFMRRKLEEIIASQGVMLQRRGQQGARLASQQLIQAYRNDIQKLDCWTQNQDNLSLLYVDYHALLTEPAPSLSAVNRFLGLDLDIDKMIEVVNPALYRQRA